MEPSVEEPRGDKQPWPDEDSLPVAKSGLRPPSEEVLASLAAVSAARVAAQIRLRRDSRRVRVLTAALLAAVAAGAFSLLGHFRGSRRPASAAVTSGAAIVDIDMVPSRPPDPPAVGFAAPSSPAVAAAPAPAGEPAVGASPAVPAIGAASVPGDPASPEPRSPAERERALAACGDAYEGHRWRSASEACASAFEASPRDAALAMKVAQAQHARSHYAEAGEWARRAIALEGADPEALVILAHAERRAGHPASARTAYRRYLTLAPRGWHASEARAALRMPPRVLRRDRFEVRAGRQPVGPAVPSSEPTASAAE